MPKEPMTKEMLRDLMPVLDFLVEGNIMMASVALEKFKKVHMSCCDHCKGKKKNIFSRPKKGNGGGGC